MEIAKLEDVPKLTKLLCGELSESFSVEQEKISDMLLRVITGKNSDAWVNKTGFMIGVIQPSSYDQKVKVANCLKVKGTKYREIFEQWGKKKGASMVMFNLPKRNRAMKNNGYKVVEVRCVKEI